MLNWAGKSAAYQTLQTPTFKTLTPCVEESIDFEHTQNVFIEGENLDVLKVLQKSYFNSVKMIYIDPPYNTGNDFIYKDNFAESKAEYAERVGDLDADGKLKRAFVRNSKENGHYHSNWLNMMLPRLHLAKNLLTDDGVIFISIDDNEQAQLKLLCDEVFGEENFVECFSWVKTSTPPSLSTKSRKTNEYILCYEKHKDGIKYIGEMQDDGDEPLLNSGNKERELIFPANSLTIKFLDNGILKAGKYDRVTLLNDLQIQDNKPTSEIRILGEFKWTQDTLNDEISKGTVFIAKTDKLSIRFQRLEKGTKRPTNFIKDNIITPVIDKKNQNIETNEGATKELKKLFGVDIFDYAKPTSLIQYLINFKVENNDLILDFFSGSGTTAHAIMQLNAKDDGRRRFICVQLPENLDEAIKNASPDNKKTLQNAIEFLEKNQKPHLISEITKERIRRAGKHILQNNAENQPLVSSLDTGFKVFKLTESHFKQWQSPTAENLADQLEMFIDPVSEQTDTQAVLYEILLRLGLKLTAKVRSENQVFWVEDENGQTFALMLTEINDEMIEKVIAKQPKKVVTLDRLFNGNDAQKKNTELQMHDADIAFFVI
ncbi:site-specific DNA-methyltransferase [Glaesserella sp.]|uniref:site-specific DNA-methyltransferase n=1 Tax=Glaesserella sp. TaxID=2094731 RepID=UPI00359F19B9